MAPPFHGSSLYGSPNQYCGANNIIVAINGK